MAWFKLNKKQTLEVTPAQRYGQQWAKASGQEGLSLCELPQVKLPSRACAVALLYDELLLVAVMISPTHAPEGLVRRLMTSLPVVNKGRFLALPQVDSEWLAQLITGLSSFDLSLPTGRMVVFLAPQLCGTEVNTAAGFEPSVMNHPLPYFLLAPRMKQGHKVASFMAKTLSYSTSWQKPMSALLEVTMSYQGAQARYYVAVDEAAERGEIWQKVLPVLITQAGRHTKASRGIELTSCWIEPITEAMKGFVYEGVVHYSEPYETRVCLVLPSAALQLWAKAVSTPAQRKEMLPSGSTVLMLFQWLSALSGQAESFKPLWRCAVSGSYGELMVDKAQVSVPELLRIMPFHDVKLIMENVLLARHSQHLNALFSYREKGEQKGQAVVRWAAADWFKPEVMGYLPTRLGSEWAQQKPSASFKAWQELNGLVLDELVQAMREQRLELTASAVRLLQQLVMEPQQRHAKELFEQQFKGFYDEVWQGLATKKRNFVVQKLNNRQWAQILVCRPQLLLELYPHISRRRALYLEEELQYLQQALQPDYAEAKRSLRVLMLHK